MSFRESFEELFISSPFFLSFRESFEELFIFSPFSLIDNSNL
jgi:hypothetical protein